MNNEERMTRLETFEREGRILRGKWRDTDADGRETACLLVALSPEAGEQQSAGACPASVMWPWLAQLTPWIDDAGSRDEAVWRAKVRRYAAMMRSLDGLTKSQRGELGPLLDYRVRAVCVREAMRHTTDAKVLQACERVAVLCERAGRGDKAPREEWAEAEAAAAAAAARWEAEAEAAAARSAEAAAAAAARWARWAEAAAAAQWAADRLIDAILTTIESGIAEARAA